MIGCFPDPHPDELLYSVCSRLQDWMKYPNKETISTELFGSRGISSAIALPSYLEYLVSNLPPTTAYTADEIIDKYSLFPYYAPFLPRERVKRLRKEMKRPGRSSIHSTAGIASGSIRPPAWLRFCPLCVSNDRNAFGECYWHRLHQTSGVLVCPIHNIFLENSSALIHNRINTGAYESAEQSISIKRYRYLDLTNPEHQILLNIAQDVQWLLTQTHLQSIYAELNSRYRRLLSERGFSFGSKVSTKRLIQSLRGKYSPFLLSLLQCDIDERTRYNWPSNILANLTQRTRDAPIRHLLLIQLLGHTACSFFNDVTNECSYSVLSPVPFGNGPWPCLNSVCPHYNRPVINTYRIGSGYPPNKRLSGIFSCSHCGFEYFRKASHESIAHDFRCKRVKSYGPLWENELSKLWRDTSKSIKELSLTLGVSSNSIRDMAIRFELPFPRVGPGHSVMRVDPLHQQRIKKAHYEKSATAKSDKLKLKRKEWLAVRKQFPAATRTKLSTRIASITYTYLCQHDRAWLLAHMPLPFKRIGSARQVDWKRRDIELEEKVRHSALRIRYANGRPMRVMKHVIGRDIDETSVMNSSDSLKKLPLTTQAIAEVIETRVQVAIRRIEWAADCFRQQHVIPSWTKLGQFAGVSHSIWYVSDVRDAFEAALRSFRKMKDSAGT